MSVRGALWDSWFTKRMMPESYWNVHAGHLNRMIRETSDWAILWNQHWMITPLLHKYLHRIYTQSKIFALYIKKICTALYKKKVCTVHTKENFALYTQKEKDNFALYTPPSPLFPSSATHTKCQCHSTCCCLLRSSLRWVSSAWDMEPALPTRSNSSYNTTGQQSSWCYWRAAWSSLL